MEAKAGKFEAANAKEQRRKTSDIAEPRQDDASEASGSVIDLAPELAAETESEDESAVEGWSKSQLSALQVIYFFCTQRTIGQSLCGAPLASGQKSVLKLVTYRLKSQTYQMGWHEQSQLYMPK